LERNKGAPDWGVEGARKEKVNEMPERQRRAQATLVRPAIRRIPPAPPRRLVLVFPPDAEVEETSPSAGPAPISHVARRRVTDETAREIELDDLELLDELIEESRSVAPATSEAAPWPPPSLTPLAMDAAAPMPVPLRRPAWLGAPRQRALGMTWAVAMLALGIAIGAVLRSDGAGGDWRALIGGVAAAPPPVTPRAPEPPVVPVVEVSALPRAVGTVVGAEGHRLWVDGHLEASFTAEVACGRHAVQVGSAGTPRDVEVRCGEEVVVTP
jgi:hypothetical protein